MVNKEAKDNEKKLRAARILLTQANDLIAEVADRYYPVDDARNVMEAKGHAMAACKKISAVLYEDV